MSDSCSISEPKLTGKSVSPSVYAFFTNLGASDNCGPVGGVYYPTLDLKFGPTDLSTSSIPVNPSLSLTFNSLGQWTAINYADFGPYAPTTLSSLTNTDEPM